MRAETVATATAPPTDREAVVGVAATWTLFAVAAAAVETAPVKTAAADGTAAAIISAASADANLAIAHG